MATSSRDSLMLVAISGQPDEGLLEHVVGIRTRTQADGQVVVQAVGEGPVEFGERRLIAGCQLRSQVLHRAFPSGHHNHDPA